MFAWFESSLAYSRMRTLWWMTCPRARALNVGGGAAAVLAADPGEAEAPVVPLATAADEPHHHQDGEEEDDDHTHADPDDGLNWQHLQVVK